MLQHKLISHVIRLKSKREFSFKKKPQPLEISYSSIMIIFDDSFL